MQSCGCDRRPRMSSRPSRQSTRRPVEPSFSGALAALAVSVRPEPSSPSHLLPPDGGCSRLSGAGAVGLDVVEVRVRERLCSFEVEPELDSVVVLVRLLAVFRAGAIQAHVGSRVGFGIRDDRSEEGSQLGGRLLRAVGGSLLAVVVEVHDLLRPEERRRDLGIALARDIFVAHGYEHLLHEIEKVSERRNRIELEILLQRRHSRLPEMPVHTEVDAAHGSSVPRSAQCQTRSRLGRRIIDRKRARAHYGRSGPGRVTYKGAWCESARSRPTPALPSVYAAVTPREVLNATS